MLKRYNWKGLEWQFEEGKQPEGAVEIKPEKKAAAPQNKAVYGQEHGHAAGDAGDHRV